MPTAPPSLCTTPGCGGLGRGGPCDDCRTTRRRDDDKARGSRTDRGYGHRHRTRFRPAVLRKNDGLCMLCDRVATVADHFPWSRRDLIAAGKDPDDPQYGRPLCKACHDEETAERQPGGWNRR